jgi:hypothetical protein
VGGAEAHDDGPDVEGHGFGMEGLTEGTVEGLTEGNTE